ncbi:MAG: hypothetical protein ACYDDA_04180 [Acidiferrobacteraceae bacterium]
MTFLQLMQTLERRLGYHQLPVNPRARQLRELFESGALHHDLAVRLAHEIYRHNRCQKTGDLVQRTSTLDAIMPIRREVLQANDTDIDVFRFIETFCEGVERSLQPPLLEDKRAATARATTASNVIPFERFRNRLRLKSLA